jgi:hypothetical protein
MAWVSTGAGATANHPTRLGINLAIHTLLIQPKVYPRTNAMPQETPNNSQDYTFAALQADEI